MVFDKDDTTVECQEQYNKVVQSLAETKAFDVANLLEEAHIYRAYKQSVGCCLDVNRKAIETLMLLCFSLGTAVKEKEIESDPRRQDN
jgi:hypothetical protein